VGSISPSTTIMMPKKAFFDRFPAYAPWLASVLHEHAKEEAAQEGRAPAEATAPRTAAAMESAHGSVLEQQAAVAAEQRRAAADAGGRWSRPG
jgi:hypothetical protein